jgi:hypothetical protein
MIDNTQESNFVSTCTKEQLEYQHKLLKQATENNRKRIMIARMKYWGYSIAAVGFGFFAAFAVWIIIGK